MTPTRTVLLLALLASVAYVGAQTPPSDLHQVGDHWTPWEPPTSFPEGAEVYTIVPGDTFWDLSRRVLGDPYLWPQIWERNRYVLDAHWIYPGDPLLLGLSVAEPEESNPVELTDNDDSGGEPEEEMEAEEDDNVAVSSAPYPFRQLGTADDIYCSGYLGKTDEVFPVELKGSEYEQLVPRVKAGQRQRIHARFGSTDTVKYGLFVGDIVYLGEGADAGLLPGDVLVSVQPQLLVRHPISNKPVGRFYHYEGRVLVLSVQGEDAIGEITQSCAPMHVGSRLKRFTPEPVPSERKGPMRPSTEPVSGDSLEGAATIVHARDGVVTVAQDHVVFIDRGEEDNLVPGDIMTVFRVPVGDAPAVVLGEIAILSVRSETSVAKIVSTRHPIYVGDVALLE